MPYAVGRSDATYFADAGLLIVIFAATREGAHGADEYARMFTGHLLSLTKWKDFAR